MVLSVVERREDSSQTTPTNGQESKEGAGHDHVTELQSQWNVDPIVREEKDSGPPSTVTSPSPPSGGTQSIGSPSPRSNSDSTSPTTENPDLNVQSKSTNSIDINQEVESLGYETDISASTLDTMSAKTSLSSELKSNEASLKCVADSPAKPRRAIPRLYTKTKIVESPENSEHSSENHLAQKISRDAQDSIISDIKTTHSAPPASLVSGSESTPAKEDKKASSSPTKSMIPTKSSKSPRDDLARTKSLKKVSTALKTLSSMTSSKIPKVSFSRVTKPPPAKGPFMYSQTSTVTKPESSEFEGSNPPKTSSVLLFSSVEHESPKQSESSEPIDKSLNADNISNNNNDDTETVETEKLKSNINNLTSKDSLTSTILNFDLSNPVSERDEDKSITTEVTMASKLTSKTDTGVQSQPERVEAATSPYISEEEEEEAEQKRPMREHLKYLEGKNLVK